MDTDSIFGDTLQQWVDEFAQKAGVQQWIPVMVMETSALAAAEVCYEHAEKRGTPDSGPSRCEDCTIYVDPTLALYPESVQKAIMAHEVAHYLLGYSRTWNWLDDYYGMWKHLSLGASVLSLGVGLLHLRGNKRYTTPIFGGLGTALTVGLLCAWRHAREGQAVELLADEMALVQFGVLPDQEWQEALREGELLRQRLPILSAFGSHPSATKRIKRVLQRHHTMSSG